jgi:hypothetical protein
LFLYENEKFLSNLHLANQNNAHISICKKKKQTPQYSEEFVGIEKIYSDLNVSAIYFALY